MYGKQLLNNVGVYSTVHIAQFMRALVMFTSKHCVFSHIQFINNYTSFTSLLSCISIVFMCVLVLHVLKDVTFYSLADSKGTN